MPRTIKQEIFSAHEDALSALAAVFPEAVKDGEVDWDVLKEILADAPSTGQEKYELTWAGKAEAKREAGRDVVGRTLRFCPEESKDTETTQNLYIEGDNLEVLKLLRENYYGAVKMIYIDPPYNTGNEYVYLDNFAQNQIESDIAEGYADQTGQRLVKNPKSSNRRHTLWLSMLYPRLRLARDFLQKDGVIFISIDDNEVHNLRKLCDEVFGENNFIAELVWERAYAPKNDARFISNSHDYILMYARTIEYFQIGRLPRTDEANARYQNPDDDPRGVWKPSDMSVKTYNADCDYPITTPSGRIVEPPTGRCWSLSKKAFLERLQDNRIYFGSDGGSVPCIKRFLNELKFEGMAPQSILYYKDVGHSQEGAKEVTALLEAGVFDGPKPIRLLRRLLTLANTKEDSIVLDFFSGSASTAQAVMQLNAEDGGCRSFICVQLPELCAERSEASRSGFRTIADIGKERIRRAGNKINQQINQAESSRNLFDSFNIGHTDIGFKSFKTSDTVIRWTHDVLRSDKQMTLDEAAMSDKDRLDFMPGFTDIDVVYEIVLRQNDIPLSAPVRLVPEAGKRTYLFADSILVCLEEVITPELVEALAAIQPIPNKFILRDSAFEDDIALKDETLRRLQACVARNTKDSKLSFVVDFI